MLIYTQLSLYVFIFRKQKPKTHSLEPCVIKICPNAFEMVVTKDFKESD